MTYRLLITSIFLSASVLSGQSAPAGARPAASTVKSDSSSARSVKRGSVLGMVIDSLSGRPLVDAVVTVVEMPSRSAMTTESGAFRIDSLVAGRYTLEILHSVLDSLGIRVVSDTVVISGGDVQGMTLAVPSAATLTASLCTDVDRQRGPGVVLGRVLDVDSGTAKVGAEVSVAWLETSVSSVDGVRTTPRLRKVTTGPDGSFRLCGLPSSLHGTLQATKSGAETGEVDLESEGELVVLRYLRLGSERVEMVADSTLARKLRSGGGVISGIVTNRGGVPISGARLVVSGSMARATSDVRGEFRLERVPVGTQVVEVRQVGYLPELMSVDVPTRGVNGVAVRLGSAASDATRLAGVSVRGVAVKSALERTGFETRKKRENGRFLNQEEIEKLEPTMTSDILRRIMGLNVQGSGSSLTVVSSRGNSCVRYMIDGHYSDAREGVTIDEFVNPNDIAAIEFYQASGVPMELQNARVSGCGLVVVWTKAQLRPTAKR